jgi:hypothetical protein
MKVLIFNLSADINHSKNDFAQVKLIFNNAGCGNTHSKYVLFCWQIIRFGYPYNIGKEAKNKF